MTAHSIQEYYHNQLACAGVINIINHNLALGSRGEWADMLAADHIQALYFHAWTRLQREDSGWLFVPERIVERDVVCDLVPCQGSATYEVVMVVPSIQINCTMPCLLLLQKLLNNHQDFGQVICLRQECTPPQ